MKHQKSLRGVVAVAGSLLLTAFMGTAMTAEAIPSHKPGDHHSVQRQYTAPPGTKINVMGEWAHPDDDVGIIGPCGVWHQRYGTRCGVIQVTRGEGGGNAVGDQSGTALGLRRENEDRVAHDRSGTVNIFYLDKVDFFYNQSAPLTQKLWDHQDTLRRATRIVRTTQPDVFIGWTPTLAAGHGNHQEAGRLIWEAMEAAANPKMFPDQLRGAHALSTWQVKKIYSGGNTDGKGGTTKHNDCTKGFIPTAGNTDTVNGVWTGYNSPYQWPRGNLQKQPAGDSKIWEQIHNEGTGAYPTQSRVMYKNVAKPDCHRFAVTDSYVPFQPNRQADGSANPAAGRDDALLAGASRQDPGGLPLGTQEHLDFSHFYVVPGEPFQATLHLKAGNKAVPAGSIRLRVPEGWTQPEPQHVSKTKPGHGRDIKFTLTPPRDAHTEANTRIGAKLHTPQASGYTDNTVHITPAVEGRFQRWGKWAEYDHWLQHAGQPARRLGRADAVKSVSVGAKLKVPVKVTNRSAHTQKGKVSLDLPANFRASTTNKTYGKLPAGKTTTVHFTVKNTDKTLPKHQQSKIRIKTSFAGKHSANETLNTSIVPKITIKKAKSKPKLDAKAPKVEYPGPRLDIGRIWQGDQYCSGPADCGSSTNNSKKHSWAKVSWRNHNLYMFAHIRDDYQSYAVKPKDCKAHWLADSVEFQIDPQGNASKNAMDTANTFKLGVFPYTNDPHNRNGNGNNGPCWERDADHHQGYSTGPLAKTIADAPNAPGVKVASSAKWVGDNNTTTDHSYSGGGYNLEVKVPMKDLPAAINPHSMGLNITPYDNDNTAKKGSNKLRHIDNSTRLGWSAFPSVQSDPYRWGKATVDGYTPPSGRRTKPSDPIIGHPNLDGSKSPQTIAQSSRNNVPIAGRKPTSRNDEIIKARPGGQRGKQIKMTLVSSGRGTAHLYLYRGDPRQIPVWTTSCSKKADPPPDYGMTPCKQRDGDATKWSPNMGGHLLTSKTAQLHRGHQTVNLKTAAALGKDTHLLISFSAHSGGVQSLSVPPFSVGAPNTGSGSTAGVEHRGIIAAGGGLLITAAVAGWVLSRRSRTTGTRTHPNT
jgi:LmbE family N-acetylglucosaminyl deacetylase